MNNGMGPNAMVNKFETEIFGLKETIESLRAENAKLAKERDELAAFIATHNLDQQAFIPGCDVLLERGELKHRIPQRAKALLKCVKALRGVMMRAHKALKGLEVSGD